MPSRRLEPDERITETVVREFKEETGYAVVLTGFLGVFQSLAFPLLNTIIFVFKGEITGGELKPSGSEILQAKWFSFEEFKSTPDQKLVHIKMRAVINRAVSDTRSLDNYSEF